MILYVGSSSDKVYPRLTRSLAESGIDHQILDEDDPFAWSASVRSGRKGTRFEIRGPGCSGERPVSAIFVRHAVARKLDPNHLNRLGELQTCLNRVLSAATCPVVNNPAQAYSNYSKPYQVGLMAEAGFDVPRTMVTNCPADARRFFRQCRGRVIYKGVSNVMTFAQVLTSDQLQRLDLLPNCPTLFQEFIAGADYRVHVIGERTFCTRLTARNEDYRRSALEQDEEITAEPAKLPQAALRLCVDFTRHLGLVVSGVDFKEGSDGRLVALEVNPFPQFTFYEGRSGQGITQALVTHLIENQSADTNVFA